jgi:RNA polymerase sigma factor (sigma-70 family)
MIAQVPMPPKNYRRMASEGSSKSNDWQLVQSYLRGDTDVLASIRNQYQDILVHTLSARGATPSEAEELVANLWDDCVHRNDDQPCLLEKFSGRCGLQSWLLTVATNRLIDFKRRQSFQKDLTHVDDEGVSHNYFDHLPAPDEHTSDSSLVDLLRECLRKAFALCSGEELLMLRLVYLHGVTQREVGRMMGWHETKVSRHLTDAMTKIETQTLRSVREQDPWLKLSWEDFQRLCETQQIGFQ